MPASHKMIADRCLVARARILARGLSQIYEDQLRPLGLTVSQLNLLVAISCMDEARAADLAQQFAMEKSTVSRNLDGLKRLGWIRSVESEGGRSTPLELTPQGRKKLDQVLPAWKKAQRKAEVVLGAPMAKALEGAAERIRAARQD